MSDFWIAFLGAAVGSVVASRAVDWLDSKFCPPEASPDHTSLAFTSKTKLRAIGIALLFSWLLLLLILISAIAFPVAVGWLFGALTGVVAISSALAYSMRCVKCHKHILVQWTTKPPFSEPAFGLEGFAAIALASLFKRRFRCMYCGQHYHL